MKIGVIALALCGMAGAQDPGTRFRAAGYLVDAVTGEPVRRASVQLQFLQGAAAGQAMLVTMSDTGGHFEFGGVTAGRYRMWAERRGYPKQDFAAPGGLSITADRTDITFRMEPYAALTGTVTDENGDPISGVAVQLIRSEIQSGRREFRAALSTVTDDRGEYRVAALTRGRYYVSVYARAQSSGDLAEVYPRRFFPAAPDLLSAAALELEPGANQRADFRLQPEAAFHIRGRVTGSDQLSGVAVTLAPGKAAESFGGVGYAVQLAGEGRFEVSGVTPGQYLLTATGYVGTSVRSASQIVAVGSADLEGVSLEPGSGAEITGRVTVERRDGVAEMQPAQIGITFQPDDSITRAMLSVRLKDDKTFLLAQAMPGEYTLRVAVPEPYYLKSAQVGGLDALSSPIRIPASGAVAPMEIAIGSNGGELSGTVQMQDKPAANCVVLLVRRGSVSASQNKFAETDANGRFLVRAVAPGDYTAYAWRDVSTVEYRNPQALAQYSGATVTVTEGGKGTVELKLNGQ